jgi:hypothetical protein
MAKILIPEDGNMRFRNFDEIVVLGRNGQVRRIVRNPEDMVLSTVGSTRKLIYLSWTTSRRSAPTWFWPAFWLLLGVFLHELLSRLSQL